MMVLQPVQANVAIKGNSKDFVISRPMRPSSSFNAILNHIVRYGLTGINKPHYRTG